MQMRPPKPEGAFVSAGLWAHLRVPKKPRTGVCGFRLAERTRFELVVRVTPYVGLANRWFQPLTHLSGHASRERYSPERVCKYRIFLGNFKTMRPKFPVFIRSFHTVPPEGLFGMFFVATFAGVFRRWMLSAGAGQTSVAAGPDPGMRPGPAGRPAAKVQICPAAL